MKGAIEEIPHGQACLKNTEAFIGILRLEWCHANRMSLNQPPRIGSRCYIQGFPIGYSHREMGLIELQAFRLPALQIGDEVEFHLFKIEIP